MTTPITKDNFQLKAATCYKKRLCLAKSFSYDIQDLDITNDMAKYFKEPSPTGIRLLINKATIAINLFGPDGVELALFKLAHSDKFYILGCHLFYVLGVMSSPFEIDKELIGKINVAISKV